MDKFGIKLNISKVKFNLPSRQTTKNLNIFAA